MAPHPKTQRRLAMNADIPSLVRRLCSLRRIEQLQAMKALRALASDVPERCADIVAAGGIPLLVGLVGFLGCQFEPLRGRAAAVLAEVALSDAHACAAELYACGGIPAAVVLMRFGGLEEACGAMLLLRIAECGHHYCTAILAAGAVPMLVPLCTSDEGSTQDSVG